MKLKMLIVSMLMLLAPAAFADMRLSAGAEGCLGRGGGIGSSLKMVACTSQLSTIVQSEFNYTKRIRFYGTNQCARFVPPSSVLLGSCNNGGDQRWGMWIGPRTQVWAESSPSRVITREDGVRVYPYTGRASQIWAVKP